MLLFLTRIGASLVEMMSEAYFFKHVEAKSTDLISLFRNTRPISYLVAPIVAPVVILFGGMQGLWIVLGGLMLWGAWHARLLQDTK